ncbi:hypothetical protein IHN63_20945, partial [Deinococcus sp. 6YEL10]|nr:hypothetical protein [Deinococcus sp. 6YEL10]
MNPDGGPEAAGNARPEPGPVVAIPVYAGVSELELGVMMTVCRLCGGEGAALTV